MLKAEITDFNIHCFDSLESTNKYCEALDLDKVEDFTCFWAMAQTAGIGQRGNHWHSTPGMNLTFSLVLKPHFLSAERQFRLTQVLSLALTDCLKSLEGINGLMIDGEAARPVIKWPNDIYIGRKKICGTLTSTRLNGILIDSAICGIGLNVNEVDFPSWVPNPTSLRLLTGHSYELPPLLHILLAQIRARYDSLKQQEDPHAEYLDRLMNLGIPQHYIVNGEELEATIAGVDCYGRLLLDTTSDHRRLCCGMKEIKYCL